MAECEWTRKICNELTNCGAVVLVWPGTASSGGNPDRMLIHSDVEALLEFKAEKTPLELRQGMKLRDIRLRRPALGFIVRKPNLLQQVSFQDCRCCETICEFDGTGRGLLEKLVAHRNLFSYT